MKEVIGFVVVLLAVIGVVIGGISGMEKMTKNRCSEYGRFYEVPTRYSGLAGCEIQLTDGRWLPLRY